VSIDEVQDQRRIIEVISLRLPVDDIQDKRADGNKTVGSDLMIGDVVFGDTIQELFERTCGMGCARSPDSGYRERLHHLDQAADVIRVRMRGNHCVEPGDADALEIGHCVSVIIAAIDQDRRVVRCLNEDAVPLVNINEMHAKKEAGLSGCLSGNGKHDHR